jgi:hypothetical protein
MHAQLVRPAYTAVLHAPLQHLTRSRSLHQHHQLSLTCTPHTMATAAAAAAQPATSPPSDPIVQYVVVRRDLWTAQGWPLGPVVAQACHAAVAAIVQELQDPLTQAYTAAAALDHMHKVRRCVVLCCVVLCCVVLCCVVLWRGMYALMLFWLFWVEPWAVHSAGLQEAAAIGRPAPATSGQRLDS